MVVNNGASMLEIGQYFPIVGKIFSILNTIYTMSAEAKKNKYNCRKAAKRCKVYEGIIIECANAHRANGVSAFNRKQNKGLRNLKGSIEDLKDLIEKYVNFGKFKRFINSISFRQEYEDIEHEIEQHLQIVQLHLSKEAVNQNNELLKRTTVLMEVDAKLAYVLNNQSAIETMTRLNYDKNNEILSTLQTEFGKINTGKSNDLNQILTMLKEQQELLTNVDDEKGRALTENALQSIIDIKSKIHALATKGDFDLAKQEYKDQFLEITSMFNMFSQDQHDMFNAIRKMDARQDLLKTNVDIVKTKLSSIETQLVDIKNGEGANFESILTMISELNLKDQTLSPDAEDCLEDITEDIKTLLEKSEELKDTFDISDRRNKKKMNDILAYIKELQAKHESGDMFIRESINDLKKMEELNYDMNDQILEIVKDSKHNTKEALVEALLSILEKTNKEEEVILKPVEPTLEELDTKLKSCFSVYQQIPETTYEDVQNTLTLVCKLERNVRELNDNLKISHDFVGAKLENEKLQEGIKKLCQIQPIYEEVKNLQKLLDQNVSKYIEKEEYQVAGEYDVVLKKATPFLKTLEERNEMQVIFDFEEKNFEKSDKWSDYKFCADGLFVSKEEMDDARKNGYTTRKVYLAEKLKKLNKRYTYEINKYSHDISTPFLNACEEGNAEDVQSYMTCSPGIQNEVIATNGRSKGGGIDKTTALIQAMIYYANVDTYNDPHGRHRQKEILEILLNADGIEHMVNLNPPSKFQIVTSYKHWVGNPYPLNIAMHYDAKIYDVVDNVCVYPYYLTKRILDVKGVDVNLGNPLPLCQAVCLCTVEIVKMLLERDDIDINVVFDYEHVDYEHGRGVRGQKVTDKNTVLDVAKFCRNYRGRGRDSLEQIINLLTRKGSKQKQKSLY
eukprot:g14010.t1